MELGRSHPRVRTFSATVEGGHKGAAVAVPFDPAKAWGIEPSPQSYPGGEVPGWAVKGLVAGVGFEGFIGRRWGRHFLLVPEMAGARLGDEVQVIVEPR